MTSFATTTATRRTPWETGGSLTACASSTILYRESLEEFSEINAGDFKPGSAPEPGPSTPFSGGSMFQVAGGEEPEYIPPSSPIPTSPADAQIFEIEPTQPDEPMGPPSPTGEPESAGPDSSVPPGTAYPEAAPATSPWVARAPWIVGGLAIIGYAVTRK